MDAFDDYIFLNLSYYDRKYGPLTVDRLVTIFQHNGFPEATPALMRERLDFLVSRGSILGGWY